MLATSEKRPGSWAVSGSRSSAGCMPVALGLYSQMTRTWSTPSACIRPPNACGMISPSAVYASRQPGCPNRSAQSIQAGLTVDSRTGCWWASISGIPSSIAVLHR